MTDSQHAAETGSRLKRLGEIRRELAVVKADRQKMNMRLGLLQGTPNLDLISDDELDWPTPEEVRDVRTQGRNLRAEADALIGVLKAFGVDEDLFTLNGA